MDRDIDRDGDRRNERLRRARVRRRNRALLLPALFGPASFSTGCGEPNDDREAVAIRDSAGISIVDNRAPDRPAEWTLFEVAHLQAPDGALTAFPWGVAADPGTGRIYVADRLTPRVVVFEQSGDHRGEYGRRGAGPGEFTSPAALSVDPYGALTVWDVGRGVLSRWSSEGDLLNERRAPVPHWGPGVYEGPGRLVTVTSETSGTEMRQTLVELKGDEQAILHTVPRAMVMMELPCIRQPAARLFAPSVIWASNHETVYVLNGTDYRIDAYTEGALAASIRRPVAPIRVTAQMAADRVRMEYGAFMRLCEVTPEQIVDAVGHEDLMAAVQWMTVDPAGRLWVSRSPNGVDPSHVDVLDSDGRYLGTVEAAVLPVAFVSESRFVGVAIRQETGEVLLSLYDVLEPPAI